MGEERAGKVAARAGGRGEGCWLSECELEEAESGGGAGGSCEVVREEREAALQRARLGVRGAATARRSKGSKRRAGSRRRRGVRRLQRGDKSCMPRSSPQQRMAAVTPEEQQAEAAVQGGWNELAEREGRGGQQRCSRGEDAAAKAERRGEPCEEGDELEATARHVKEEEEAQGAAVRGAAGARRSRPAPLAAAAGQVGAKPRRRRPEKEEEES